MTMSSANAVWVSCLGIALLANGCAPSAPTPAARHPEVGHDHDHDHDHDHKHDHDGHGVKADTLADGVKELGKVIAAAKRALAERDFDEADGHVHMVGHLVDDLHRLVAGAKLPVDAEAAAKKALDDVFASFDALDTTLHAADEAVRTDIDYAEHEPQIAAALNTLTGLASPADAAGRPVKAGDVDE